MNIIYYKDFIENSEKYIGIEFFLLRKLENEYRLHGTDYYHGIITEIKINNFYNRIYIMFIHEDGRVLQLYIDSNNEWAIIEKR